MVTLVINIPETKSTLVKQILKGLGVTIQEKPSTTSAYKDKLTKVSTWNNEDLKAFDEAKDSFNGLKSQQW
jgi:cysteine synthase